MEKLKKLKNHAETLAGTASFIELIGNGELMVSGCLGINDYSGEKIVVMTRLGKVSICGKDMKLTVYRGDVMTVEGTVTMIDLGDN